MSGGFTPILKRTDVSVSGGPSFLASEHYQVKRGGITLAASAVTADSKGDKIVLEGTLVTPITSGADTGKYKPATDTADANVSAFTLEAVNLKDGDVICGGILHGSVLGARVHPSPLPAALKTAIAGRITVQ